MESHNICPFQDEPWNIYLPFLIYLSHGLHSPPFSFVLKHSPTYYAYSPPLTRQVFCPLSSWMTWISQPQPRCDISTCCPCRILKNKVVSIEDEHLTFAFADGSFRSCFHLRGITYTYQNNFLLLHLIVNVFCNPHRKWELQNDDELQNVMMNWREEFPVISMGGQILYFSFTSQKHSHLGRVQFLFCVSSL